MLYSHSFIPLCFSIYAKSFVQKNGREKQPRMIHNIYFNLFSDTLEKKKRRFFFKEKKRKKVVVYK